MHRIAGRSFQDAAIHKAIVEGRTESLPFLLANSSWRHSVGGFREQPDWPRWLVDVAESSGQRETERFLREQGYQGTNDSLVEFVALCGAAIEAALRLVI
jgi:hypothetical protein